ncbi:hypothetical protein BDK51DRAFT_29477, partial [Blyttiomyces helicus]
MPIHAWETDESVYNKASSPRRINQQPQETSSVFSRLGPPVTSAQLNLSVFARLGPPVGNNQSTLQYAGGPAVGTSNRGKRLPEAPSLVSHAGPPAGHARSYPAPPRADPYEQSGGSARAELPFSCPGFSRASSVNDEDKIQSLGSEGSTGSYADQIGAGQQATARLFSALSTTSTKPHPEKSVQLSVAREQQRPPSVHAPPFESAPSVGFGSYAEQMQHTAKNLLPPASSSLPRSGCSTTPRAALASSVGLAGLKAYGSRPVISGADAHIPTRTASAVSTFPPSHPPQYIKPAPGPSHGWFSGASEQHQSAFDVADPEAKFKAAAEAAGIHVTNSTTGESRKSREERKPSPEQPPVDGSSTAEAEASGMGLKVREDEKLSISTEEGFEERLPRVDDEHFRPYIKFGMQCSSPRNRNADALAGDIGALSLGDSASRDFSLPPAS